MKPDPRPVYVVVNAGSNTLAQALVDYQANHSNEEMDAIIQKLRVYENGAQDNAGAWVCSKFPDIHWTRSNYQTYCYGGPGFDSAKGSKNMLTNLGPHTWHPYGYSSIGQHQWALDNIIANHGALGKCFPLRQSQINVILLFCVLFIFHSNLFAQAKNTEFYYGVAWYPEQWDETRWQKDLDLMTEKQINSMRLFPFKI